jgi:hypothetical protein
MSGSNTKRSVVWFSWNRGWDRVLFFGAGVGWDLNGEPCLMVSLGPYIMILGRHYKRTER